MIELLYQVSGTSGSKIIDAVTTLMNGLLERDGTLLLDVDLRFDLHLDVVSISAHAVGYLYKLYEMVKLC